MTPIENTRTPAIKKHRKKKSDFKVSNFNGKRHGYIIIPKQTENAVKTKMDAKNDNRQPFWETEEKKTGDSTH